MGARNGSGGLLFDNHRIKYGGRYDCAEKNALLPQLKERNTKSVIKITSMAIDFQDFFFSSRRRLTSYWRDWSAVVCAFYLWLVDVFIFSI